MSDPDLMTPTPLDQLPMVEVSDDGVTWYKVRRLGQTASTDYKWCTATREGCMIIYRYARPVRAPKLRPMTHAEIFDALKDKGCWVRSRRLEEYYWSSDRDLDSYEITRDGGKTWSKMEVEA